MDFNSLVFLGFFCAVAVLNYVLPRFLRPVFLLAASYAFYLYEPKNASLVALLIAATVITWASGLAIGRLENKWAKRGFLALSLLTCMGTLFFYKYYNFFGEVFSGGRFRPLELVAPLGLSYFTFQSLGYVLDVFMGKQEAEKNPIRYALFVSFFPAIVTGPIEQAGVLLPQIAAPRRFDYDRCAGGLFRMLWGYVKKMVIADNLGLFVGQIYARPGEYGGPYLAAAALLFALQLYMDFSGCCDVAIGAARVLGYDLTENFRSPFLAPTFRELWRRWHMSLTGWFRRYVYIPLGGNRKGAVRQCVNLLAVFLLSGLWHGAAWGYVWWGVLCGALSVGGMLLDKALKRPKAPAPAPIPVQALQAVRTYVIFALCFVLFAGALYGFDPVAVYGGMLSGWDAGRDALASGFAGAGLDRTTALMLAGSTLGILLGEAFGAVSDWIRKLWFIARWPIYYALCLLLLFFGAFGQSAYIYQQY